MNNYLNERAAAQAQSENRQDDSAALMRKYWEQAAEAEKLQSNYLQQQNQAEASLKKQDELLSRWERVIEKWEKR